MVNFSDFLKKVGEIGYVVQIKGVLVYCSGLEGAKIGEKVIFENEQIGIVNGISKELTEVLVLDLFGLSLGSMVVRTSQKFAIGVSKDLLGRVINALGEPIDGKAKIKSSDTRYLDSETLGVIDRARISENLETGVLVVDLLIPIGRGQRQLVIGDHKTGRTTFLVQTIARQAQLGTICIYTFLGKKRSDLTSTLDKLKRLKAKGKTIVVAAPASTSAGMIYLAPFCAFTIAEYFRDQGRDVLVVLDEISMHAKYFREMSLLSKRMPGREAYPGDIFHLHARLLERAGRFYIKGGKMSKTLSLKIGGPTASISCLPVVETAAGELVGYIQTNLMSMTDGHIFFDVAAFLQGLRPAVNIGQSVTRVGKKTQMTVERELSFKVRDILFEYTRSLGVAKFGVELLEATREKVVMGERLLSVLDQHGTVVIPKIVQLLLVELLICGFWQQSEAFSVKREKEEILNAHNLGKLKDLTRALDAACQLGSFSKFEQTVKSNLDFLAKICKRSKS